MRYAVLRTTGRWIPVTGNELAEGGGMKKEEEGEGEVGQLLTFFQMCKRELVLWFSSIQTWFSHTFDMFQLNRRDKVHVWNTEDLMNLTGLEGNNPERAWTRRGTLKRGERSLIFLVWRYLWNSVLQRFPHGLQQQPWGLIVWIPAEALLKTCFLHHHFWQGGIWGDKNKQINNTAFLFFIFARTNQSLSSSQFSNYRRGKLQSATIRKQEKYIQKNQTKREEK